MGPLLTVPVALPQGDPGSSGSGDRASANNGVEVSSNQAVRHWGSYGSAYDSSTSSMRAKNSAFTLGMHRSCFYHCLSVVVQRIRPYN